MAAFNLASKMAAKLSFQSFLSSLHATGKLVGTCRHKIGELRLQTLLEDFLGFFLNHRN